MEITDGTNIVGLYPAPQGSPGIDLYSWIVDLADNSVSPQSNQITTSIPALVLPGGYTIGSRTPAMASSDQWSNVAIWWNDNQDPNLGGAILPYDYHNLLLLGHLVS